MIFHETSLPGAYLIELERIEDERGHNARTWCEREFEEMGLTPHLTQSNIIYNRHRGTVRGLHWQVGALADARLFSVIRGAVHDVIADLREGSDTYGEWESFRLSADEPRLLYVPECFAQGLQSLEDDTEIIYQVSTPYTPEHGQGLRFDDPAFDFDWPLAVSVISEKDRSWPDFVPSQPLRSRR